MKICNEKLASGSDFLTEGRKTYVYELQKYATYAFFYA